MRSRLPHPVAILTAALMLSACVPSPDASSPTGAGPVKAVVSNAVPGPSAGNVPLTAKQAYGMYADVCLKTLPRFSGAKAAALRLPTTYNPAAEVYVHRRLNSSFKVVEGPKGVCSMVFASRDHGGAMALAFSLLGAIATGAPNGNGDMQKATAYSKAPDGTISVFEPMPPQGGVPYYHAYVALSG